MVYRSNPVFSPRPWGDPWLNSLFGVNTDPPIGEVWLLSGLEDHKSEFLDLEGKDVDLTEVVKATGLDLPRFPLLIKLISTTDWLSVQVHPDDELAVKLEGEPWGKNEGWYFLSDGVVALGSVNAEELRNALETESIERIMKKINVSKGDFLYLPAGTLHALGPGTKLIEIQQTSDLTYRVFDWGRPRPLHIEKALLAVKPVTAQPQKAGRIISTPYFSVEMPSGNSVDIEGFAVVINRDYSTYVVPQRERLTFESPWMVIRLGRWWYERFGQK